MLVDANMAFLHNTIRIRVRMTLLMKKGQKKERERPTHEGHLRDPRPCSPAIRWAITWSRRRDFKPRRQTHALTLTRWQKYGTLSNGEKNCVDVSKTSMRFNVKSSELGRMKKGGHIWRRTVRWTEHGLTNKDDGICPTNALIMLCQVAACSPDLCGANPC